MRTNARLAGSWWIDLPREQATAACYEHLLRMRTSNESYPAAHKVDSTNLYPPAKRRFQGRPAPLYTPDAERGETE